MTVKRKVLTVIMAATLSAALSAGCGSSLCLGDEITEVKGVKGADGTILYFTRTDYSEVKSSNNNLDAAVNSYMDEVFADFYDQAENLAIAQADYDEWDVELDGRPFPTATEEEFEEETAEGVYYDVIRIIVESKKAPYISLRCNRITYSSKNNFSAETQTATFDAKTGERLSIDDMFDEKQQEALDDAIRSELEKTHGDELKDGYEEKIGAYKKGVIAKWYIEKGGFVVLYDQGSVCSLSAGEVEVHVTLPK